MLNGNIQKKRSYLHTTISYKDENGVRKKKWQFTGLTAKGSYCKNNLDYVCVDSLGVLLQPDYLTQHFEIIRFM